MITSKVKIIFKSSVKVATLMCAFFSGAVMGTVSPIQPIDKVQQIRARLLAYTPTAPVPATMSSDEVAQWFNFPNWPNWGNWGNGWGNWGNWGKW